MSEARDLAQSIKIDGAWRTEGKGPHDDIEVRVAYSFLHGPTLVAFLQGVELEAVWLTIERTGWRMTFKGARAGKHLAAYLHGDSFSEVVTLAATTLDLGKLVWWPDDHPVKR